MCCQFRHPQLSSSPLCLTAHHSPASSVQALLSCRTGSLGLLAHIRVRAVVERLLLELWAASHVLLE